jgi:hypothetical protein
MSKVIPDLKLDFRDVLIRPRRSQLKSRSQVSVIRKFKIPVRIPIGINDIKTDIPQIAPNGSVASFTFSDTDFIEIEGVPIFAAKLVAFTNLSLYFSLSLPSVSLSLHISMFLSL